MRRCGDGYTRAVSDWNKGYQSGQRGGPMPPQGPAHLGWVAGRAEAERQEAQRQAQMREAARQQEEARRRQGEQAQRSNTNAFQATLPQTRTQGLPPGSPEAAEWFMQPYEDWEWFEKAALGLAAIGCLAGPVIGLAAGIDSGYGWIGTPIVTIVCALLGALGGWLVPGLLVAGVKIAARLVVVALVLAVIFAIIAGIVALL